MLPLWKRMRQLFLPIVLVSMLFQWLTHPLWAEANTGIARQTELSGFTAILATQGVAIEWQANGESIQWRFVLYRSQNCQFDGAQEVIAPIFSSINDETQVAHYSLTDTEEAVIATCAYWLVATEDDGQKQHYGPYQVQGRSTIFLPVALH
ncbi:MAG: hypothetical protein R3E79_29065 [Caldilineaceae bacterium]